MRRFDTVVDVGSGPVPYFCNHNVRFGRAVAVDPLAVPYSKIDKYQPFVSKCEYSTASGTVELLSGFADAVFCMNTLDHCQDPAFVLGELKRIARPVSKLFFQCDVGKKPDHLHPHTIDADWVSSVLLKWFSPIVNYTSKSWKFDCDVLWFVGDMKNENSPRQ